MPKLTNLLNKAEAARIVRARELLRANQAKNAGAGANMAYTGLRSTEIPTLLGSFNPGQLVEGLRRVEKVQKKVHRVEQDTLYSCYLIPAGAAAGARYEIFRTAIGQPGQGFGAAALTSLETNLENNGSIPAEYGYAVYAIGCMWDPFPFLLQPGQYAEVGHRIALSYSFLEKEKYLGPAVMYPAGGGITGFSTINNMAVASNGSPGANNLHALAVPIYLPSQTTFKFTLEVGGAGGAALTAAAAFRFWVRLACIRAAYVPVG